MKILHNTVQNIKAPEKHAEICTRYQESVCRPKARICADLGIMMMMMMMMNHGHHKLIIHADDRRSAYYNYKLRCTSTFLYA
jgi:hypothetical protein